MPGRLVSLSTSPRHLNYLTIDIFEDHFMKQYLDLGMDIGSVSINTVVLNPAGEVIFEDYRRTQGEPFPLP